MADVAEIAGKLFPRVMVAWAFVRATYKALIAWAGPFGMAIFGMFLMMLSVSGGKPSFVPAIAGGLMILSAMEVYGLRAREKLMRSLAEEMWSVLREKRKLTFAVAHTYRADDETFAALRAAAQGMEARQGGDEGSVHDSPVHAPETGLENSRVTD